MIVTVNTAHVPKLNQHYVVVFLSDSDHLIEAIPSSSECKVRQFCPSKLLSTLDCVCLIGCLTKWSVWQLERELRPVTWWPPVTEEPFALLPFSPSEGRWPPRDVEVKRSAAVSLKSPLSLCFSLILSLTSLFSCYAKLYSACQTLKNWQNAFSPPQCHTKYININAQMN